MNGPVFPPNPTPGQVFCGWMWNGTQWICLSGGQAVVQQVFTVSGSYIPSPGLVSLMVECVGGGGGGGGAVGQLVGPPASTDGWMMSGGGGAGGCYSRSVLAGAVVLGGAIVTVGAGGLAGVAAQGALGGQGGTTSFGALVTAPGGNGGAAGTFIAGVFSPGGGGGRNVLGIGQLAVYGSGGEHGQSIMFDGGVGQVILWGGMGGGSHFQSGGVAALQSPTGGVGATGFFGAGGGGGASVYASGPALGGAGGNGLVLITEYCLGFGDGPRSDCGCGAQGQARIAVDAGWQGHGGWNG